MTLGSLFAGIGGFDLGLERAGFEVKWQVENDPFCNKVLEKHWPHVRRWSDVRDFEPDESYAVDCICAGFPCQDVSCAGKGVGLTGERSGLFAELHRIVAALRPRWGIFENVPALRTRGYDRVASSLEALGYACWPLVVGAEHVGAPHRRHRVFLVVHTDVSGLEGAFRERIYRTEEGPQQGRPHHKSLRSMPRAWPARPGAVGEIPVEADGLPGGLVGRRERLASIGNAVSPVVAEVIGRAVLNVAN